MSDGCSLTFDDLKCWTIKLNNSHATALFRASPQHALWRS